MGAVRDHPAYGLLRAGGGTLPRSGLVMFVVNNP
jgi:hypothetical protein